MSEKYLTGIANDPSNFIAENQEPRSWDFLDRILKKKNKNIKILDVGCGTGNVLLGIWLKGYKNSEGVEYSKELFGEIVNSHPNLKISSGNAEKLEGIPSNKIDLVYCHQVLEHLPNPKLAVREAHRVLKKGGEYVVGVPNGYHLNDLIIKRIQDLVYKKHEHIQSFSLQKITNLLKDGGFTIKKISLRRSSIDFLLDDRIPQPLYTLTKKLLYPLIKRIYWKVMYFDILAIKPN